MTPGGAAMAGWAVRLLSAPRKAGASSAMARGTGASDLECGGKGGFATPLCP